MVGSLKVGTFTPAEILVLSLGQAEDVALRPDRPGMDVSHALLCSALLCSRAGLSSACIPLCIMQHHSGISKTLESQDSVLILGYNFVMKFPYVLLLFFGMCGGVVGVGVGGGCLIPSFVR